MNQITTLTNGRVKADGSIICTTGTTVSFTDPKAWAEKIVEIKVY